MQFCSQATWGTCVSGGAAFLATGKVWGAQSEHQLCFKRHQVTPFIPGQREGELYPAILASSSLFVMRSGKKQQTS